MKKHAPKHSSYMSRFHHIFQSLRERSRWISFSEFMLDVVTILLAFLMDDLSALLFLWVGSLIVKNIITSSSILPSHLSWITFFTWILFLAHVSTTAVTTATCLVKWSKVYTPEVLKATLRSVFVGICIVIRHSSSLLFYYLLLVKQIMQILYGTCSQYH